MAVKSLGRQEGESLVRYCDRLRCEKGAARANSLATVWGDWLEDLGKEWPWDWFGTFTFSNPSVTSAAAHYFFHRFIRMAAQTGVAQPYAFRADEYGPRGGRLHLHALIGNVSHLQRFCGVRLPPHSWGKLCCWVHRWPCGYARILAYDASQGARYYVSKYVMKALGDWELLGFDSGNLRFRKLEKEKN
jgi:hypothetical protein